MTAENLRSVLRGLCVFTALKVCPLTQLWSSKRMRGARSIAKKDAVHAKTVAEKDAALAEKDAENEWLRTQLAELQANSGER